jgi:hypothetical protein
MQSTTRIASIVAAYLRDGDVYVATGATAKRRC